MAIISLNIYFFIWIKHTILNQKIRIAHTFPTQSAIKINKQADAESWNQKWIFSNLSCGSLSKGSTWTQNEVKADIYVNMLSQFAFNDIQGCNSWGPRRHNLRRAQISDFKFQISVSALLFCLWCFVFYVLCFMFYVLHSNSHLEYLINTYT